MNLHEIGLKHGTDKSTYHGYMAFYEKHFKREQVKRFLEIGVLNGSSIRSWREWFPKDAVIEGWDINPSEAIDGCDLKIVNQLSREQMLNNVTGIYDIILDDGGHTAEMIQLSFSCLFPHTKAYVIEDLHAPWTGSGYLRDGDINTLDIIKDFNINGWNSTYATQDEIDYINNNAEIVALYINGEEDNPLSATCIIKNNAYKN